jgi:hypothetical protein
VLRYLSHDWLHAVREEAARSDDLRTAAAGYTIAVTQVVTGGPEGDVIYHLDVIDGVVTFGPGPAAAEDIRFVQDWDTAVAVATGAINAQEAFLRGRVTLIGDQQRLIDAQPVFAALDAALAPVRERTVYVGG